MKVSLGFPAAAWLFLSGLVSPALVRGEDTAVRAAFRFAIAKSLTAEGSYAEALAAFDEASGLAPDDPYIRTEHALLLARLTQAPGLASAGGGERAAAEIGRALAVAPDDLDVLRSAAQVYLTISTPDALDRAVEVLEKVRAQAPGDLASLLPLGRIYLDRDRPEKAAEVFSGIVKFVPNSRMANGLLIESLLRAGQLVDAERALVDAVAASPEALEPRLMLADLQQRRGDVVAALATLDAAPVEARADPDWSRQWASSLYLSGDLSGALSTVDGLLAAAGKGGKKGKADAGLRRLRGSILAAEGRSEEAAKVFADLANESPDDLALALALARAYDRLGRHRDAEKVLLGTSEVLATAGKAEEAVVARLELGALLAEAKLWPRVREVVEPLLASEIDGVADQATSLAADAAVEQGDLPAALGLVDRALGSSKAGAPARSRLEAKRAELLFRSGREAEAEAEIERLAGGDPSSVIAAAQALQRVERRAESRPILERLTAAQPDLAPAEFLLGAACERLGDRACAAAAFKRALALEPDFHAALNYLGYMWAEKGENLDEALALVRRAVALDPDNGAYVDSLGWALFQRKQYAEARDVLERAARLMPADPTVHEHLGDLYRQLGEVGKARGAYRRALALAEDEDAAKVRSKLAELPRR